MATRIGEQAVHDTLVANQVEIVRLKTSSGSLRITNRAPSDATQNSNIYIRADGSDPVVRGDFTAVVLPSQSEVLNSHFIPSPDNPEAYIAEVRLVAPSNVPYSVSPA